MADDLKRKRGFAKASLTRLEKNILQMNDTTTSIDIHIQLEQLEKIYSKLTSLDEEIVQLENSDQSSEVAEFENRYFSIKSKLRTALKNQTDKEVNKHMDISINRLSDQQRELVQSIHETSFIQKDEVKLQAVQIPSFSGNYAEFPTFKDLFEVTIDKSNLSKIHKFKYLKGLLQGEAFNLIRHMTVTEANYDEAWGKIVQRYDVKDQICSSLIKQFLEQSQSNGCPKSVRYLADKTDEVLRGLKALGTEAEQQDVWLNYLLLQKCDVETRRAWALENEEAFPKIETLLKFLVKRANALERAEPYQPKRNQPKLHMTTLNMKAQPQLSNITGKKQDAIRNNKVSCPKCKNEHYLYSCEEFIKLPLEAKREFILSKQLCFICMKSSHSYRDCRSKYRCTICKGRHNSLLHVERASNQTDTKEELTPAAGNNQTEISSAHVNATSYSAAILPTALVRVKDALGNFHLCKAMLDSGSQASFVEGKLANKLQLQTQKARITVSGLATRGLITRGIVELDIYPRDHENEFIKANALILDRMSLVSNPPRSTIQDEKSIHQLKLAAPEFYTTAKVKLLLGADVFFSILRSKQPIK